MDWKSGWYIEQMSVYWPVRTANILVFGVQNLYVYTPLVSDKVNLRWFPKEIILEMNHSLNNRETDRKREKKLITPYVIANQPINQPI
jgi:hypothetical protein